MRAAHEQSPEMNARRVLIIEDDVDHAAGLEALLRGAGYDATTVGFGFDGEDLAASNSFGAVFLDLSLPDRDGMEVARNLRRRRVESVVIIVTGRESMRSRVDGLDLGADDYVTKPYDPSDLLARLRAKLSMNARLAGRVD